MGVYRECTKLEESAESIFFQLLWKLLCEFSQKRDKEQIWMGKQLICVLLQPTARRAHFGLLPCLFYPLFVTRETPSQSTKDNLGKQHINDRACPVL